MFSKNSKENLYKLVVLVIVLFFAFSLAPIGMIAYSKTESNNIYLGGFPIGISLKSDGLVVEDYKVIITQNGSYYPAKECGIQIGDVILSVNGAPIKTPSDLEESIGKEPSILSIEILRKNKKLTLECKSVYDPIAGNPKLGLIVKNEINGIGTMTYYDDKGNFCALGHKISDSNADNFELYQQGMLYNAKIMGVYKGKEGEAGALKGVFDKNSVNIGNIYKNTDYGIYGSLSVKPEDKIEIKKGSKNDVVLGKAYIYSTLNDSKPDKYEIEIVKAINQNSPDVKSMVIRVTDDRLIDIAGGIVQGMSGSPIVQNDKLIGAITHVFLNDAKIGYGVYIDWLN